MDRSYRFRVSLVIALLLLISSVFCIRLFALQLTRGESAAQDNENTITYTQRVSAARGNILDRNGTVLVYNRATYNVTLNSTPLYNSGSTNEYLLELGETCNKNGIIYKDTLPVSQTRPYAYILDELSSTAQYNYRQFLLNRTWDADMTAENLIKRLRSVYHIPEEYTEQQARMVIGLRYELDLPVRANTDTYTMIEDISAEDLAILKELAVPGMTVEAATVREYNTTFAAQLLGHTGAMQAGEYEETYEALGYPMNAYVGVDGLEKAFEEYLHGTDGVRIITVDKNGAVVAEDWETRPQSGANVVTTIDIGLQEVAEKALAARIQEIAEEGKAKAENTGKDNYGEDACAGAVVVMDVKNFDVLAAANYPTYDPADYKDAKKYREMSEMEVSPLRNRALDEAYPPGSTFKPISAITALRYGFSPNYTTDDTGWYTRYEEDGYAPRCWYYTANNIGHGVLDMRGAIAQSCNIFFYTVGDVMGDALGDSGAMDMLSSVAFSFGVGEDTGSEIPCAKGHMASAELKAAVYAGAEDERERGWYRADTMSCFIGQSLIDMTPLQSCRYISALANGGTLYNATFLRRAVSSDYQTLVKGNDNAPVATGLVSEDEWQIIQEGMRMCVTEGTGSDLRDYPIAVCAKTGTAQHGVGGSDHGAFVCWAPADNPEIAISIYVEHGASGSNFVPVAEAVLDYYFGTQNPVQDVELENQMTED